MTSTVHMHADPRVPGLERPTAKCDLIVEFPPGWEVVRQPAPHGAQLGLNKGGMAGGDPNVEITPQGVRVSWSLRNGNSTPLTGRDAILTVTLSAVRTQKMELSDKYRRLRQRLLEQFYFDGLVAESIEGDAITFADQTIYLGQALIAFASERAILHDRQEDVSETEKIIATMLDAIDWLDSEAEPRFGAPAALDGFFVRDNITGPDDPRLAGRFARVNSDWQSPANASPSGDQIMGLLFGLSFVHRYGGPELSARAQQIAALLFDYPKRCNFNLTLPDGNPVKRGAEMQWFASLVHGVQKSITGANLFDECRVDLPVVGKRPLNSIGGLWASDGPLFQLIDGNVGKKITVPMVGDVEIHGFALHQMLMMLAIDHAWNQDQLESVAGKCNHPLSVLAYCTMSRSFPKTVNKQMIEQVLTACPDTGPCSTLDASTGWQRDNRWIRCTEQNTPDDGPERRYNGVDFLILHNLNELCFHSL